MFAKLRCGAGGALADAGHWLQLHSTVRLRYSGQVSQRSPNITSRRLHHAVPYALHHTARSPSGRFVAVIKASINPRSLSTLALHQAARRALLRFVECVAYTPPTITHRGRSRRPRTQPSQPSAVHRPSSIVHRPSQPSARSAISHQPPPRGSQAS
jgi:hypothetical protein